MAHSRARQDAKRRENMDAEQLTEQTPAGCRESRGAEPTGRSPEGLSRAGTDAKRLTVKTAVSYQPEAEVGAPSGVLAHTLAF